MPNHCESMGPGWSTVNGQCVYNPQAGQTQSPAGSYFDTSGPPSGFTGTVGSLGYSGDLAGTTLEDPAEHEKYFDPYDFSAEERYARTAAADIGQLGTAWDLKSKQLGETWGLKRGELGWGAGLGLGKARRTGIGAKRKSGMAFSGTAEEMQRLAESNVRGKYEKGLEAGKTAYEQALEAGQLGLQQATTDIYQELEADTLGEREDWRKESRTTLNMLLGRDIWYDTETQHLDDGVITDNPVPLTSNQECYRNCDSNFSNWWQALDRGICRAGCESRS